MPYTRDGRRVELMINLLAVTNRTTAEAIIELFLTGMSWQVRKKMMSMKSNKEREKLLFDFIYHINEKEHARLKEIYDSYDKDRKKEFISDAMYDGIYMHQPPIGETIPMFYRCIKILEDFKFLSEDKLFIRKWGMEQKILTDYIVGEMYIMKLKQSDRRGFIARSTGAIDGKSLPTRSYKHKSYLEQKSTACIRFGEFETLNFSIGVPTTDIALFHALYRTSIKGRADLIDLMFSDDSDKTAAMKLDDEYVNRVAEVFNVVLRQLGLELEFSDENMIISGHDDTVMGMHTIDGDTYFCTNYQFWLIKKIYFIRTEILNIRPIISVDMLNKLTVEILRKRGEYDGQVLGDLEEMVFKGTERLIAAKEEELNMASHEDDIDSYTQEETKEDNPEVQVVDEAPKKKTRKKKAVVTA